jgi:hypothetical protein
MVVSGGLVMAKNDFDLNALSPTTRAVMVRLKDWKKRREQWKTLKFIFDLLALIFMLGILWFISHRLNGAENLNQFYAVLFSRPVVNAMIFLIPTLIVWKFVNMKYNEYDEDYETLRKEIIDRADELWFHFPEDWQHRQEALEFMDKTHGVNLFYKKK